MKRSQLRSLVVPSILLLVIAAGCARPPVIEIRRRQPAVKKDYGRALPPGAPALRLITDPARLPDFRPAFGQDRHALLAALDHSIRWFTYPSSKKYYPIQEITHERAQRSLAAFREILLSAKSAEEFHQRIISQFDVYESVGCDDEGTVLFTGYYTPIFDGRLAPDAEFRWPLYKLPPDLVKDEEGNCLGRRTEDGSIVPYYTRAEIEAGVLRGLELVWLRDRFEAYICTVQGSAKLRLPDGTLYSIGYHGNNGKPYTSIGQLLVNDGLIQPEDLSLAGLIKFFRDRPDLLDTYLPKNERYVFFRPAEGDPTGSLGVPVTPYCTLATDKAIFPRGCLTYVVTQLPSVLPGERVRQMPFERFLLDQDTGGGIRAPGRADVYVGVGDAAGLVAGHTFSEGRLYYIFLRGM